MRQIEEIYKKYYNVVFKYLLCLTKNSDIAEELTQETFLKMIKKIHTIKDASKISTWLCVIARNLWYDQLRKNKYKTVSFEDSQILENTESIENEYINKEEFSETNSKIESLDNLSKRVLYLRLSFDMSFKEIGDVLGKSETWARVTFYRAKRKIKEDNENGK